MQIFNPYQSCGHFLNHFELFRQMGFMMLVKRFYWIYHHHHHPLRSCSLHNWPHKLLRNIPGPAAQLVLTPRGLPRAFSFFFSCRGLRYPGAIVVQVLRFFLSAPQAAATFLLPPTVNRTLPHTHTHTHSRSGFKFH